MPSGCTSGDTYPQVNAYGKLSRYLGLAQALSYDAVRYSLVNLKNFV